MAMFLFLSLDGFSQLTETFSDNDFTANPTWTGDVTKFGIDNFQLRLQAPAVAGNAFLSTSSSAINDATWEFTIKLDFNPSNGNYARIYVVSDQPNLSGPLNGYFVNIGDTPDEISLYRQTGTATTKIIDGVDGRVNLSVVNASVKLTRDPQGNWELFSDVGQTGTYTPEGNVSDNTFKSTAYFGVYCVYTSTRSDKFYYDNFLITGNSYVDLDPPVIEGINVISSNSLMINFNEELDPIVVGEPSHYEVGNMIDKPLSAVLQSNQKSILLNFTKHFQNAKSQSIQISGIKDLSGNVISKSVLPFLYFNPVPAKSKDIVLTEIFADPSPQIGLPDAEFVEFYNRSNDPFDFKGWIFTDGSSKSVLPSKIILPGEYLVITSSSNQPKFGAITNVIGVSNFPTLNNAGDTLVLKSPNGITIDSVNYNLSWYRSADKQEGGWTLELIDPANPCGEEENWTTSENELGGTPGFPNSVFANKPDLTGPALISVSVLAGNRLLLQFNEKLEKTIAHNVSFAINPNVEITKYFFEARSLRSIVIDLKDELTPRQLYTISVNNLFDCNGNIMDKEKNMIAFALPEEAENGDVIVNEILFNPRPNGVDFVELYNRSEKYINIKDWKVGNLKENEITNPKVIATSNRIISPHSYTVLTSNSITLKNNYPQGKADSFIQLSIPSFPDNEGSVAIASSGNTLIDHFNYNQQFHSQLIKDVEGVSLERVSFIQDSNDRANWGSASSVSGFATPGFLNSNFRSQNILDEGKINIEPLVFAPNSGRADFSLINFRFDQPGFVANVTIYDHQGRTIKTIANNATLGNEGFFRWDGDQDDGGKARAGYYFVWFQVFNSSGTVKTFRERVIIAP